MATLFMLTAVHAMTDRTETTFDMGKRVCVKSFHVFSGMR